MQQATKGCFNGAKSQWALVLSDVLQGTVFGPLLFFLYIKDIMGGIESEIGLIADDCVCYHETDSIEDTSKHQKDTDQLGKWARK